MQIIFYVDKDTTLYHSQSYDNKNTGEDEILELTKRNINIEPVISRSLVYFDLDRLFTALGRMPDKVELSLPICIAGDRIKGLTLECFPVKHYWSEGFGKFTETKINTNDSNWLYSTDNVAWDVAGGDVASVNPKTCTIIEKVKGRLNESTMLEDPKFDITEFVQSYYISGSSDLKYGFLVKFQDAVESNDSDYGTLCFYSKQSNTIYRPKLNIYFDDYVRALEITDEDTILSLVTDDNYVPSNINTSIYELSGNVLLSNIFIFYKNLSKEYSANDVVAIRLNSRPKWQRDSYNLFLADTPVLYLPTESFYGIFDAVTDEQIIGFSEYTKISSDIDGNYFNIWMDSLVPQRMYKIKIKLTYGNNLHIFDNNNTFMVTD
jgi:hypothetical protein